MNLLQLREKEIFEALKALKNLEFVIIGGYAVNAYTLPRFSVDCDILIREKNQLKEIELLLIKIGYNKVKSFGSRNAYHGEFFRYEKLIEKNVKVSMDLMFNEVLDRQSKATFSAAWVIENSNLRILRGKTITESIKLRIAGVDALIVMKISSCRNTDIRDVFMLMPKAEDIKWIKEEINKRYNFKEKFSKLKDTVNSKKFKDNLQGVYGFIDEKTFEKHKKAIFKLED